MFTSRKYTFYVSKHSNLHKPPNFLFTIPPLRMCINHLNQNYLFPLVGFRTYKKKWSLDFGQNKSTWFMSGLFTALLYRPRTFLIKFKIGKNLPDFVNPKYYQWLTVCNMLREYPYITPHFERVWETNSTKSWRNANIHC